MEVDAAVVPAADVSCNIDDREFVLERLATPSAMNSNPERALSRYRSDDAQRDCCAELQAAATTWRHVVIAAARSTRCV